jgi:hypothetical protein
MSTLWTPSGERPVRKAEESPTGGRLPGDPGDENPPTEEEMRAQMAELEKELARTPAATIVANHAYGLFELAALHLSLPQPQLEQARLAIDALAALVDGLGERLGPHITELAGGLDQLRRAFVQIHNAAQAAEGAEQP